MYFLRSLTVGVIGILAFSVIGGSVPAFAASRPTVTMTVVCEFGADKTGGIPLETAMKVKYKNPSLTSLSAETAVGTMNSSGEISWDYDTAGSVTVKAESSKTVVVPLKLKNSSRKVSVMATLGDTPIAQMDFVKPVQLCGEYQGGFVSRKVWLQATSTTSVKVVYRSKKVTHTEIVSVYNAGKDPVRLERRGTVFWETGKSIASKPIQPTQVKKQLMPGKQWTLTVLARDGAIFGKQRKGSDYEYGIYVNGTTSTAVFKDNELGAKKITPWWRAVAAAEDDR